MPINSGVSTTYRKPRVLPDYPPNGPANPAGEAPLLVKARKDGPRYAPPSLRFMVLKEVAVTRDGANFCFVVRGALNRYDPWPVFFELRGVDLEFQRDRVLRGEQTGVLWHQGRLVLGGVHGGEERSWDDLGRTESNALQILKERIMSYVGLCGVAGAEDRAPNSEDAALYREVIARLREAYRPSWMPDPF